MPAAVKVTSLRDTLLLVVTVDDTDPVRAAAIANTIPEVFREAKPGAADPPLHRRQGRVRGETAATQAEMDKRQAAITQLKNAENGDAR